MELLEKINKDFMSAYKNRDMETKNYLGFLKSEVTKETKTPDDAYIVGKFKAMIKNSLETNSLNSLELDILNKYVPRQMTSDELETVITTGIIDGINKNMGSIMKYLRENYAGEYDGKMASELTKEILKA
jgi:uncharacterized protein YqeY